MVSIVLAVLTFLGGGGIWGYVQSKRRAPIEQRDANLVAAEKSQQMALNMAERLEQNYVALRDEFVREQQTRQSLSSRVETLEAKAQAQENTISQLRNAIKLFKDAWADLVARWEYHRLQDTAPTIPPYDLD